MKKALLVSMTILTINIGFSQTEKSKILLGGNGNIKFGHVYSSSEKDFDFDLAPKAAYFIVNNFALGLDADLGYHKYQNSSNDNNVGNIYSFGPFARYYFRFHKNAIIIELSYNYGRSVSNFVSSSNGISPAINGTNQSNFNQYAFGAGYCYFIKENVSLEALYQYRIYNDNSTYDLNGATNSNFLIARKINYGNIDFGLLFYF